EKFKSRQKKERGKDLTQRPEHKGHRAEHCLVECGGLPPLFLRLQFPSMPEKFGGTDNRETSEKRQRGCRTPKNKTPRPKSGRTFQRLLSYQTRYAVVKEKLSKNQDFCKSLKGKGIRREASDGGA